MVLVGRAEREETEDIANSIAQNMAGTGGQLLGICTVWVLSVTSSI